MALLFSVALVASAQDIESVAARSRWAWSLGDSKPAQTGSPVHIARWTELALVAATADNRAVGAENKVVAVL